MKLDRIAKSIILIICFSFLFTCVSEAFTFDVIKTSNTGEFGSNETVVYMINISNGDDNLTFVEINDTYNATYLNFSNANITPTSTGTGWVYWFNVTNGTILENNSWFLLEVNMTTLTFGTDINNTAWANASNSTTTNTSIGNVLINITKEIGFDLVKFAHSYNVEVGQIIGYGINVTNTGDTNLTLVNVTDTFNTTIMDYNNSNIVSTSNSTNGDLQSFFWFNITNETGPMSPGETRTVLLLNMTALNETNDANTSVHINVTDDLSNSQDAYTSMSVSIIGPQLEDWDDGLSDWESYIASPYILQNQEKNLTFSISRQAGDDSCLNNITIILPSTNFTFGGYNSTSAINYIFTFNASGNGNDFVWTNTSSGFFCGQGPKNFTLEINSTDAFKSANFEITAVANGTSSSSINLTMYTTTTFSFNGSVRDTNGNVLENATASMTVGSFGPNGDITLGTFSALSDSNGDFNITGIAGLNASQGPSGNDMLFYLLSVVQYNGSNQQYAMAIGPSLPDLPEMELNAAWGLADPTVYLKPAVTFYVRSQGRDYESGPNDTSQCNENGCNDTAFNFTFLGYNYGLKDKKLGFPVSYDHGAIRPTERYIAAPLARNYSLMVFPSSSFPIYVNFNDIEANCPGDFGTTGVDAPCTVQQGTYFINVTINATTNITPFTGSVDLTNIDALRVVPYMLGGGEMIFDQDTLPFEMGQMMRWPKNNSNYSDFYNLTNGNFTIFLPATEAPSDIMLMAFARNGSNYYLDYFKLNSSGKVFEVFNHNFNMNKLLNGTSKLISSNNISNEWQSANIVNTTAIQFQLVNESNSVLDSENSFIEMKVDINGDEYRRMTDASNGVFTLPMIKGDSIKELTIYSQAYAPIATYVSASVLNGSSSTDTINCSNGVCNITMTGFDEMLDPNGSLLDLVVDFYVSNSSCDVPSPNAGCEIMTGMNMSSEFSPFQAILRGDLSLRMSMGNISVHYVNTDLLASGPPDASFTQNASEASLEAAWKFGSQGPEIYDYVLIGMPYNASNIQGNITINITLLYDNEFNVIWNVSDGDNTNNISNDDELASFRDYLNNSYEAYLNGTGVLCNKSDSTLSAGLCYEDNVSNMIWMKIPHFSGIGPKVVGSGISPGPINYTISKASLYSTYYINSDAIVNYVINITNNGDSNLTLVNINDTFDSSLLAYNASSVDNTSIGTGWVYWYNVTNESSPIAPGNTFTLYLNMTALDLGSGVQNNISVNASNASMSSTATASVAVDINENTIPYLDMINSSFNTSNSTPIIYFEYNDSYSNATCTLYFNNVSYKVKYNVNNGTHNITASTVPHGEYNVSVSCTDDYNNTNQTTPILGRVQYAMNVTLISPNGSDLDNISTFNVSYSVNIPAECNITIWLSNGNIMKLKSANVTNGTNYASFGLEDGSYSWNVNCTDFLNRSNYDLGDDSNWSFIVNDEIIPDINITSPTSGREFTSGTDDVTLTVETNENTSCRYDDDDGYNGPWFFDPENYTKDWESNLSTAKTHSLVTEMAISPGENVIYYVQCWDPEGNNATANISFSIAEIDDGGGGSSSSGGGGTTTTTEGTSQAHIWNVVEAGQTATMTITKTDIGLEKIEFTASTKMENVELQVTKKSTRSVADSDAPGSVFQYLNMDSTNVANGSLTSIYMYLRINKSWITSNNIDENTVALYRWETDKWTKLVTVLSQKGTSSNTYRSVVPGFSEFAIAGESSAPVVEPTTVNTTDIQDITIKVDNTSDDELIHIQTDDGWDLDIDWKLIGSIAVLITVIVFVSLHYYFKVYKTLRKVGGTKPKSKKPAAKKRPGTKSKIDFSKIKSPFGKLKNAIKRGKD